MGNSVNIASNKDNISFEMAGKDKFGSWSAEMRDLYCGMFSDNPATMLIIDPGTGKILDANRAACEFYGYTSEEFRNVQLSRLFPPGEISHLSKLLNRSDGSSTVCCKQLLKDNRHRDVELKSKSIKLCKTDLLYLTLRDITEQNRIEKERELFYQVFTLSGEGTAVTDESDRFVYVNPAHAILHGYTAEELIGKTWKDIAPKEAVASLEDMVSDTLHNKESGLLIVESFLQKKDGSVYPAIISGISRFDDSGRYLGHICIVSDLTYRKDSEQKMIRLQKAIENSGEIILTADNNGIITYVNPVFIELYGYTPEEVVGKATPQILNSEYIDPETFEIFNRKLKNKEIFQVEFINKTKSGKLVSVEVTVSPIVNDWGEVTGYMAVQRDITPRKIAEEELKRARDQAEESNVIKATLLDNMNHELRTPMTGIIGLADLMRKERSNPFLAEMADGIYSSAKRLMATFNSILAISQLSGSEVVINLVTIDLCRLVDELTKDWSLKADEKGLVFEEEINASGLYIQADENMIRQVINNLIDNAIKFTFNGYVKVELAVEYVNYQSWAVIKVKDTGIGIAEENFDLIFNEFRQVSTGYNRSFEGCGLGLTLAKKMIEKMGGSIKVESKQNQGSVFIVSFPVCEPESPAETDSIIKEVQMQTPESDSSNMHLPTVLIIEDNLLNARVVEMYLKDICIVEHAKNGMNALDLVKRKSFDAILMDINLGSGLSGIEVMKEIRKIEGYSSVPVIAVTGYAMPKDTEVLLKEGFDFVLAKPFEGFELTDIIHKALS